MMRVEYLPVNQAWAVVWGDGQLLDVDGQRLWDSRDDLLVALRYAGLKCGRGSKVSLALDMVSRNV